MPLNFQKTSKKKGQKGDSFLEAFRDLREANYPSSEALFQKEEDFRERYRRQLEQTRIVQKQEQILFTRREKEAQQQVKALQEEIKQLAKATGDLAKEVEITAMQEAPLAGTYHVNFFERLRGLLKSLRSQIQESSYWLASWNKKAQKRNFYWGQFKKSGSKFMLSADRYMSTQAG